MDINTIYLGDSVELSGKLEPESIQCIVTSPPYWGLRDYGADGQFGMEKTPEEYVSHLVDLFSLLRLALKKDGTIWLNLGDTYIGGGRGGNPKESKYRKQASNIGSLVKPTPIPNGYKPKDLAGIPWLVAFALRADGWYLRSEIIWEKPNVMPSSVTDRPTVSHEHIFLLSKSQKYHYNAKAISEKATSKFGRGQIEAEQKYSKHIGNRAHSGWMGGDGKTRNKRTVWSVNTKPLKDAHFATFPVDLITPCILAGCPEGGVVLDPFMGAGTTAVAAKTLRRNYIGFELNPEYIEIAKRRIDATPEPLFLGDTKATYTKPEIKLPKYKQGTLAI